MMVELVEYWLEKADEQNAAKTEADSACKADIAVQVQQASGVIPPADVPFPFQPCPRDIFKNRAEYGRKDKDAERFFRIL